MKKILFLGPPFEYLKGGAEYQYKILEQHLSSKYEIYYIFRHSNSLREKKYITYDYRFKRKYKEGLYTDSLVIYRLIKGLSPDIIYKRGINYISAIGVYYAKSHNANMVLHIAHQRNVERFRFQFKLNTIFELLNKGITKYVIRNASKIICQAKYQNILLKENYGKSCNLLLPNFHPTPESEIRKKLPVKIVWIANFKQWKQPELFVELAERFQNDYETKFIMIGRAAFGVWQDRIFEKLNRMSNIDYKGELSIDEVNRVLNESHIFVNTSKQEGFPNTYIQAWMRKVPVVALNCDPDDLIKKKGIGFHSKTFSQMVLDVKRLVKNQPLREKMGEKSSEIARTMFSDIHIKDFIRLIDNL
jgi:glycosyltransferase involved in cell wall biosynthesis